MKNKELMGAFQTLNNLEKILGVKEIKNSKLNYMRIKNLKALQDEIQVLRDAVKPSEGVTKYQDEVLVAQKEFFKVDEKDEIIIGEDSKYIFKDGKTEEDLNKQIDTLSDKYKEDIEAFEKEAREIDTQESTIQLHKIKIEDLPEDLDISKVGVLYNFIQE